MDTVAGYPIGKCRKSLYFMSSNRRKSLGKIQEIYIYQYGLSDYHKLTH